MARADSQREQRHRTRIAQVAARLISEHGITDWGLAKRKACRELGLSEREALPGSEEIEQALRDYNSLFRHGAQAASLRQQRRNALRWMDRLAASNAAWDPVLIGGVAAGWAPEHSHPRLELEAEDAKTVELALINAGIAYAVLPGAGADMPSTRLVTGTGETTVELSIVTPQQRRNRRRLRDDERITAAQLRSLLAAETDAA